MIAIKKSLSNIHYTSLRCRGSIVMCYIWVSHACDNKPCLCTQSFIFFTLGVWLRWKRRYFTNREIRSSYCHFTKVFSLRCVCWLLTACNIIKRKSPPIGMLGYMRKLGQPRKQLLVCFSVSSCHKRSRYLLLSVYFLKLFAPLISILLQRCIWLP